MNKPITLSAGAVRAVILSSLPGPCCIVREPEKLRQYLRIVSGIALTELSKYFSKGVVSSIVNYAVFAKKRHLDTYDIARMYSIDHQKIVQADEMTFESGKLADDPGLSVFHERGFRLTAENLPAYLYSCIGKVGVVTEMENGLATVMTSECLLHNIFASNSETGDTVLVHFSAVVTSLSDLRARAIRKAQIQNGWYKLLCQKVAGLEIDYSNFCGGNLTQYARTQLRLD